MKIGLRGRFFFHMVAAFETKRTFTRRGILIKQGIGEKCPTKSTLEVSYKNALLDDTKKKKVLKHWLSNMIPVC